MPTVSVENAALMREALLAWYDSAARVLPWRAPPGTPPPDPYRVWLSEVMLQQTTVAAVIPYFERFLQRFPTVADLAKAQQEDVLQLWAGLGYYSRGRNLHAAAQIIAARGWPKDEESLRALPGVGAYTAAAVAAIAFGKPATVVDGNVERVMARLFAVQSPLPAAKIELRELADAFTTPERPGDFAQALMDLGATVCTPKSPACPRCPFRAQCHAAKEGSPERYPLKSPKAPKVLRYGVAFVLTRNDNFFLVRRPPKGLLAGMAALPTTPWREAPWDWGEAKAHAPTPGPWIDRGAVSHVFTHFPLTLQVWAAAAPQDFSGNGHWVPVSAKENAGLPTVFLKAAVSGLQP